MSWLNFSKFLAKCSGFAGYPTMGPIVVLTSKTGTSLKTPNLVHLNLKFRKICAYYGWIIYRPMYPQNFMTKFGRFVPQIGVRNRRTLTRVFSKVPFEKMYRSCCTRQCTSHVLQYWSRPISHRFSCLNSCLQNCWASFQYASLLVAH